MTFPRFDIIAAAVADPTRAQIVCHLMDGRAFTNKELASATGVTPQTISGHMTRMVDLGLIKAEKSGRTVYHRLAGEQVAGMLEQMSQIAPNADLYNRQQHRAGPTAFARCCYNHLAGQLGVALTDAMTTRGDLASDMGGLRLTDQGRTTLGQLGVQTDRAEVRPCLDWTERRHHIAGPLATAMLTWFLDHHWLERSKTPRALTLTAKGRLGLQRTFGLTL